MPDTAPRPARADRETVWITGGAGFIGRAVAQALRRRGVDVVCVDRQPAGDEFEGEECTFDEMHAPERLAALAGARAIVHLAGAVGVRRVVREPEHVASTNRELADLLLGVLERLPRERRPRVFAASTSEVYMPKEGQLAESDPVRRGDETGRWAYAASKVLAERRLDAGISAPGPVHLRFFNVVGPGQDSEQGMMLPTFVEHALRGEAIPVHGAGTSVRTLAHVDDVAATIAELVLHADVPSGPLNVGGTARASVLEVAQCVLKLAGSRAGIVHVDPRVVVGPAFEDVAWREPDLARLRALGVCVPQRSLEAIVRDTLERHAAETARRSACGSRAS
jgi:nucleoside-diphosphate-sugar epimerase